MGEKMGFERAGELAQIKLGDCLWDVHAAGMKVLEFTAGRDLAAFREHEVLQSAVRTMLDLMASRLTDLRRGFPAEFARIAGAEQVIDLGADVGDARVWRVVQGVVPDLVAEVRAVLEEWHQV